MKQLPNLITLINLISGCFAIVALWDNQTQLVIVLLVVALLADFLDGLVARLLKAYSDLGKQLDSLSDLISFGFLPACMIYTLLLDDRMDHLFQIGALPAFFITAFTAIRLGRFNLDQEQQDQFKGLPSPANAILISGFWMNSQAFSFQPFLGYLVIIASCYLLVAPIKMVNLKFKNLSWRENKIRFIFIFAAIIIFLALRSFAPLFIILLYISLSLIENWFLQKK